MLFEPVWRGHAASVMPLFLFADKEPLTRAHELGSASAPSEWELSRWRRVLAVWSMMVLTVGLQFSFASTLEAFKQAFPSISVGALATVGSVSMGLMDVCAAISGLVILRFDERAACICGGVLAGLGLFLASFATEFWGLIATYGGGWTCVWCDIW